MSKAPSMPMYWDAYLADTTHLTTEEHGAYLLLLAAMWRRDGSVPDDDKDNARIVGVTVAKWRKIKARLVATIAGIELVDGVITQEKLQKTWQKTQETIEKNKQNGAKGGRPKSKENNNLAKANGFVSDKPSETIPEPEPEPDIKIEPKGSTKKRRKPLCELPENWVPNDTNIEHAANKGFTQTEIDHEANQFRNFHHSKQNQYRDWDAAWRTWIGNAAKRRGGGTLFGQQATFGHQQGGSIASIAARRRSEGSV